MKTGTDKLWAKLYWPKELTRPDHLAKILNLIIRQDNFDNEVFIYYRNIANGYLTNINSSKSSQISLSSYDKLRLTQLNEELLSEDYLHNDSDEQNNLSRQNIDKLLHDFFDQVILDDKTIEPRPIDAKFIDMEKLSQKTQLVRFDITTEDRSISFKLSIRCKSNDHNEDSKTQSTFINRIDRVETQLTSIANQVSRLLLYPVKNDKITILFHNKSHFRLNSINYTIK